MDESLDNSDEDELCSDEETITRIKVAKTKGRIKRADLFFENEAISGCIQGIANASDKVQCRSVIWQGLDINNLKQRQDNIRRMIDS